MTTKTKREGEMTTTKREGEMTTGPEKEAEIEKKEKGAIVIEEKRAIVIEEKRAIVIEEKEIIAKEIEIMNAETKIEDIRSETIVAVKKGHKKKTPTSSKDEKLRGCEEAMQAKRKKWRASCKRK